VATGEGALFVNGVLVRSLDLNDTYIGTEPLHPSEVLPTAIALCEENGRSGRELIEAMVAGYEASMRVNDAISLLNVASIPCVRPPTASLCCGQDLGASEGSPRKCGWNIGRTWLHEFCGE
jgi:MmgE/PrpD N-terminal domain